MKGNPIDWFPNGAEWYTPKPQLNAEMTGIKGFGYHKYKVEGDTIVDGLNAKKISYLNKSYDGTEEFFVDNWLAVREESGKVYHHKNDSFELIFDFNLSPGDTLAYRNPYGCDSMSLVVDSVKNVSISGQNLQKQFVTSVGYSLGYGDTVHYEIIEKIGVLSYIESAPMTFNNTHWCATSPPFGAGFLTLRCYTDVEIQYNEDGVTCDTLINLSSNEIEDNNNLYFVHPNPVSSVLNVNMEGELKVFDLSGTIIGTYPSSPLNVSNFSPGLYFISDNFGNSVKFIIE